MILAFAPVAQLDRVSGYEPEGRGFESLLAHHANNRTKLCNNSFVRFCYCKKTPCRVLCGSRKQSAPPPAGLFGGGAKAVAVIPYDKGEIFVVVVRRICYNNHKSM